MIKKLLAGAAIATALLFTPYGRETVSFAQSQGCIMLNGVAKCTAMQLGNSAISISTSTGVSVVNTGEIREVIYKVTVDKTAFTCAAVTCDVTIGTLPAKTFVVHALADVTQVFACTATCTSTTLSAVLGKTAGGSQYLASFDADAATAQFGDSAIELGNSLNPTTFTSLDGDLGSWTTTTAVVLRMTSGTGNIGSGSATNFSTGSITFYLTTVKMP